MCYACLCFFKRKTAYEMRISDWSSDVCSSDLGAGLDGVVTVEDRGQDASAVGQGQELVTETDQTASRDVVFQAHTTFAVWGHVGQVRSEERRVGNECVSPGRSRWSTYH